MKTTAEKTKTIQEILSDSGFDVSDLNGRQRAVRSLNSVFKNSEITMKICDKGMVWETKQGFKYNVVIRLPKDADTNIATRWKAKDFSPYGLLKLMAQFLRQDNVKEIINADTEVPCKCMKCDGKGHIPAFYYYAEGVCFDCLGVGFTGKLMVQNVKKVKDLTGRKYTTQFLVSKNYDEFPEGVENIKPIAFIGHPTAEQFLAKKDGFYYLHQPVCRANGWYAIPEQEFEKFKKEYKKTSGIEL